MGFRDAIASASILFVGATEPAWSLGGGTSSRPDYPAGRAARRRGGPSRCRVVDVRRGHRQQRSRNQRQRQQEATAVVHGALTCWPASVERAGVPAPLAAARISCRLWRAKKQKKAATDGRFPIHGIKYCVGAGFPSLPNAQRGFRSGALPRNTLNPLETKSDLSNSSLATVTWRRMPYGSGQRHGNSPVVLVSMLLKGGCGYESL
jgi:hypothetical protein